MNHHAKKNLCGEYFYARQFRLASTANEAERSLRLGSAALGKAKGLFIPNTFIK